MLLIVVRRGCLLILLFATLLVGCRNRPLLKRSDFYLASAKWASTDDAFSFENSPVFEGKVVSNSGSRSADKLHFTLEVKTNIHGTTAGAAQVIKELGAQLKELAESRRARTEVKLSKEKWFEFRYFSGDARGTVVIRWDDKEFIVKVDERIP